MSRTFSVRLDDDLAHRLSDVASVMGRSQADLIRTMLTDNLNHLLESPTFQKALTERQEALDRLSTLIPEAQESPPLDLSAAVE